MYGDPELPPDFAHLRHVNPNAPRGGRIVFGESGGFDSLNPYILRGRAPWGVQTLVHESLMARNWDEPFALYGLLAETVETDSERSWVEFTLREEARFSDGSPVTPEDVLWSFETLAAEGMPRYANAWNRVTRSEVTGPRSVRFHFDRPDRELPLILGLRPVLSRAAWEGRDFARSGMQMPVGSGPYVIESFEAGRNITFRRNPDYWGRDLPINRGQHNLDEIRYEFFADGAVIFEAFKAGEITSFRDGDAARWERGYDFPAARRGDVVRSEIGHSRPSGMAGLVLNARRPPLDDWRVREALIQAFSFEFINETVTGGRLPRITSYFSNAPLAMRPGPAEGRVRALLEPFADTLPPGALEGYALPVSDGSQRNRAGLRRASALLDEAGLVVDAGTLRDASGAPVRLEVLLEQGAGEILAVVEIYGEALRRLGIELRTTVIDPAQYRERIAVYDYDIMFNRWGLSLSPGNEQRLYWGREGVTLPGTRNYAGIDSEAVEHLIEALLNADDQEDFVAHVRALDRVLTAGRHVVPIWFSDRSFIAHRRDLRFPERIPLYGDWIGWQPEVWWWADD
ncbi:MAG: ABC transporter substrate-binding protein [Rhodobacteraceae bacterium]|nr:ABC transporter substrate-binding protein [Paracoccaceae bacterium]